METHIGMATLSGIFVAVWWGFVTPLDVGIVTETLAGFAVGFAMYMVILILWTLDQR